MNVEKQSLKERLLFLNRFFNHPRQVGSITPSSRFLAKAMVASIDWSNVRHAAELGPGTGIFTAEIDKHLQSQATLIIAEKDQHFREMIKRRFAQHDVIEDAKELSSYNSDLDCIISGLPFKSLPENETKAIMTSIIESLNSTGSFVTFQYSLHMKKEFEKHFQSVDIQFVPLNIPPAFVYVCTNKKQSNENRVKERRKCIK